LQSASNESFYTQQCWDKVIFSNCALRNPHFLTQVQNLILDLRLEN